MGNGRLHDAAEEGDLETVRTLLNEEVDINEKITRGESQKLTVTALHEASAAGHDAIVQLLLECGAWVDAQIDENGYTALHCAAEMGRAEVAKVLLSGGASAHQMNKNDDLPIHLAAAK